MFVSKRDWLLSSNRRPHLKQLHGVSLPMVSQYLLVDPKPASTYRSRLRFDLSRLNKSRHTRGKSVPSPLCPNPQCSYAGSLETPEHVLLHCDNFLAERLAMKNWLESIGLQLTLPSLLGVVPGSHQKMAMTILSQTSQFICQIQKRRHF